MTEEAPTNWKHWLQDRVFVAMIGLMRLLPYAWRVQFFGWITSRVISPLAGYDRRVRDNLAKILPEMDKAEVERIVRAVPNNVGRNLIEMYSGRQFIARAAKYPPRGDGLAALEQARASGRPVVIVTGHFGNYLAARANLIARGYRIGGLYRPMDNAYFNHHYVAAMEEIGKPMFPRGTKGLGQMIRFLKEGGMLGLLLDQRMVQGARLSFFGHEALTALSAAELALKYDALLIPVYAIRKENGLDFDILVEAPIPQASAEAMTQALNDSLEALVRQHMDQWFWIHRRWKP